MQLYVYKSCQALRKGGDGYYVFFGRNGVDIFIPNGFVKEDDNGYMIEAEEDVCFMGISIVGKSYLAMRYLMSEVDLDSYRICKAIFYKGNVFTCVPALTDKAASRVVIA